MEKENVELRKNKQQRAGSGGLPLTLNSSGRNIGNGYRRSQTGEVADSDDFRQPWYSKCRRPYFWISIIVLVIIITDALFEGLTESSMLGTNHWISMRVLDLILSISVFMQSKKLESLLDEKETFLE